jgi:hypothetical protein
LEGNGRIIGRLVGSSYLLFYYNGRGVLLMEGPNMTTIVTDHEDRIKALEINYSNLVGEISSVKDEVTFVKTGQLRLENTVLTVSQNQNGLLNTLIANTFDLKKTKTISRKEIIIAGIGSGGILGIIVGAILKFL